MTQSGRELDALVATQVMGWKPVPYTLPVAYYPPGLPPIANALGHEIPHYSTSIVDAWTVVDKLRELDRRLLVVISGGGATVSIHTNRDNEQPVHDSADTAPHAICLAALRAVVLDTTA